jgi:hypothetical protein
MATPPGKAETIGVVLDDDATVDFLLARESCGVFDQFLEPLRAIA